jgi:ABC-type branched-subunit amino acid transport system ATPase component/ABC-type branched-subunit amino acid transport system permease subunit
MMQTVRQFFRTQGGRLLAFSLAYLGIAALVDNSYYQLIMTLVLIWAVMGCSWNVFSGYSGLISFGHAAFFGLGAYVVALLFAKADISPWLGIPVAMVVCSIAGLIVGIPTFRLRGHYFALAMLAYPLTLLYVFEWLGFQEVSLPLKRESAAAFMQFSDQRAYMAIALGLFIVATLVSSWISSSRLGLSLAAIRQNEAAAEASGIDTLRCKLTAITISGAMAGAAGGFYAVVLLIVTPNTVFGLLTSAQALIVTIFGGAGTVWGPLIGAAVLIPLSETLHAELGTKLPGIQGVVFGVAIIMVTLFAPGGLIRVFGRRVPVAVRQRAAEPAADVAGDAEAAPMQREPVRLPVKSATREVLLRATGLSKSFGGLTAVNDVSFVAYEGEVLGLIGPNGAGKTTLFNLLNGFIRPDRGQVEFEGHQLVGEKPNRVCRAGVGRTFQVMRPFRELSVVDNVRVGALVHTSATGDGRQAALEAIDRVELASVADKLAGQLTTVELRLMEIARALASQPRLLLLDETLAGLGGTEVDRVMRVLRSLAHTGVTVVIIEHTMRAMVELVDRFVVLDHGAVISEGVPDQVMSDSKVIEAYLGKRWVA